MSKFTNYTLFALLLASIQPVLASESASPPYVVPKLVAQTPMNTVNSISDFFSKAENKVKIQFPSNETRYVWQNMSRFYTTAPILRDG
ncbi:hypothetical protein [Deefgea rivuli]|uniref:hypothetical protein n=1 Tax=Deefgea rivuli TaxID=400948 RepID=UPI001B802080|nr:hypothetical protein [Deefgea rivuli]